VASVSESELNSVAGASAPTPAIEVRNLEKHFGDIAAVDGISFTVMPGEIFAFLGPNGAGKTTAINVGCTLVHPTRGQAWVAGFDVVTQPQEVRRRIGLVFQETTLDAQLTAEENLRFHAVMYRVPKQIREQRITRVLELLALANRRRDLVSTFSGGMQRRLEIARGMLHTPAVLFLDEPTIGLDPQTRALMWDDVLALRREEGMTVFLTTHYMDEAEVADRIAIIDYGRLIALDTPANLKESMGSDTVEMHTADDAAALVAVKSAGYRASAGSESITVFTKDGEAQVGKLVETVGGGVKFVHVHQPTLEDVFLHLTGRQIREEPGEAHHGMTRHRR
jgi:ABC-2 type transport system ATP-binding protein